MSLPPLIEYRHVAVLRGRHAALDDVSLAIAQGEHVAILGHNGAGKSTLIKTITRELYPLDKPDSYLRILGEERWDVFALRAVLGLVSEDVLKHAYLNATAREVVLASFFCATGLWPLFQVMPAMEARARAVMASLGITPLMDTSTRELSTGQLRLVLMARAHDPPTLLLDEPTANLDFRASYEMRRTLQRLAAEGRSLVMITHDLTDIIPETRRVIVLKEGRIVADGPKETVLTTATLSELFGVPLEVVQKEGYYYCL